MPPKWKTSRGSGNNQHIQQLASQNSGDRGRRSLSPRHDNYSRGWSDSYCTRDYPQGRGDALPHNPPFIASINTWHSMGDSYRQVERSASGPSTASRRFDHYSTSRNSGYEGFNTRRSSNSRNQPPPKNQLVSDWQRRLDQPAPGSKSSRARARTRFASNGGNLVTAQWKAPVPNKAKKSRTAQGPAAPAPPKFYLKKSTEHFERLSKPAELLVILDLNGTLLCRKEKGATGSSAPVLRPGVREFLAYLFSNFKVMIWTSARPENALRMVDATFSGNEKEKLLGIWGRDTLGLTQVQYNAKVQVYKTLTRVWEGEFMIRHPDTPDAVVFDQTNTVLFDDSTEKAAGHPYNLINIPEFLATSSQIKNDDVLRECIDYLDELKWQSNASAFIRKYPFEYTGTEGGLVGEMSLGEEE